MNIGIHIFLLCYNEKIILPATIHHYRTLLPGCHITILDNISTDGSPDIARQLGCQVRSFQTGGHFDDYQNQFQRNHCWKHLRNQWIIVCDMDEWLCITKEELQQEYQKGTTLLDIKGYDMIGDSKEEDLRDLSFHRLAFGIESESENKPICFLAGPIREMNFEIGGHRAFPQGNIVKSNKTYILKHMNYLGLPFKLARQKVRFDRSHKARQQYGLCFGYTVPFEQFINNHDSLIASRQDLSSILHSYLFD
jgi:glycosyltransferase involved in cell wall biosynthesis